MNELNENPVTVIFDLYNEFRLCVGLERDDSPAENVWLDYNGKPQVIKEPEDEAAFMDITVSSHIEIPFTFDMVDTDEDIETKLKLFKQQVLNHKQRHWTCLNWSTDKSGKKRDWAEIRSNLRNSLIAYRVGKPYSVIVSELNLADSKASDNELKYADKKAKRLFIHAERLIEASKVGFHEFIKVAMEPLPRNL